jgi:GntR family transcriptional regulator, transcriptional repressor for pyruvate dehydrogenase complex
VTLADDGRSLTDRLRDTLAARIEADRLKPGDRLPTERELIAEFGVSRTVVRDALSRLREQGLVESRQGSGVYVRDGLLPPSRAESIATLSGIIQTIEVRAAIEIEAARLASVRASDEQRKVIDARFEALRTAEMGVAAEMADLAFHRSIAHATNNTRFEEFFDFLGGRTIPRAELRARRSLDIPEGLDRVLLEEHRRIRDAILANDAEAAGEAMRYHLTTSRERYAALIRARQG